MGSINDDAIMMADDRGCVNALAGEICIILHYFVFLIILNILLIILLVY